jgi:O-antigen/teichoic acid export membrane protein
LFNRLKHISPKILVLSDQVVVSAASFMTNMIIARSLGAANYGKFSVIILVQLFLLSLQQAVSSGIFQVMFPGYKKEKKQDYASGMIYLHFILYTLFIVLGLLGFYLFRQSLSEYHIYFLPALIGSGLFLFQDLLRKMLLTMKKEMQALIIDVITNVLQIAIILALALCNRLTLPLACWIIALTFLPSVIAGVIFIHPGRFHPANLQIILRMHKKQSPWMFMSALLQWFSGNFFVVASGLWLGAAALGALRLSQYIFGLLNVCIQAVENYAIPHAAGFISDPGRLKIFLLNVLKKTFFMIAPVLLLISIFPGKILVMAGGASYLEFGFVLHGLSAVYILILIGIPIRILLRVKLLNRSYFIGYLMASVFSMLMARWLISSWQLTGVLIGLFCTQFIVLAFWISALYKKNILTWKLFTSY